MTTPLCVSPTPIRKNPFLTIPFQSFEIENTYLLQPEKDKRDRICTQLCYKDSSVEIQDIPLITPPLKVHHYDIRKSLLFLEIDTQHPFYQKFHRFQEFLIQTYYNYQHILIPHLIDDNTQLSDNSRQLKVFLSNQSSPNQIKTFTLAKIRSFFQLPLKDNFFTIYIHPNTVVQTNKMEQLQVYQLISGTYIRCILRLYNIITVKSFNNYLRIQHSVPSIWFVGAPKILKRSQAASEKCAIIV
jgi:hypothetical protein